MKSGFLEVPLSHFSPEILPLAYNSGFFPAMLLTGSPPNPGQFRRYTRLTGAADALALAQYAQA